MKIVLGYLLVLSLLLNVFLLISLNNKAESYARLNKMYFDCVTNK